MRRVTQQEGEGWRALAEQHGFGSAEGRFVLGRFIVEGRDENGLMLCVVTPIPAGLDTGEAQFKTSPVMFDRTPANEIVVPGRWWQLMFENVSADPAAPVEMRQMAAAMVATTLCSDVLLPPDSDTVEIGIADSQGNMTAAKAGDCDKAFKLTLMCQCHDGTAQEHLKAAGPRAVCGYLMSK